MKRIILLATLCSLAAAQNKPQDQTAAAAKLTKALPSAASSTAAPLSSARYETFTNVTIPAGQTVILDSMLDYSSSDTVRVTVRSAGTDLLHFIGTAYFTVPNATEFVTQEVMFGSDFNYSNSGGTTFQVAGSQLRLALYNNGTSAMTLSTVILYTHVL